MSAIPTVTEISRSLFLRRPQEEALDHLARALRLINLQPGLDPEQALSALSVPWPKVTSFERKFVNLCFALATGVGKTRLMGAFVSYLYREHKVRNFLVLAPNLTIYRKLIADFTPNTPKYVFQGLPEFSVIRPDVVTGENWRTAPPTTEPKTQQGLFYGKVRINVFNIAKLVGQGKEGDGRLMHALQETLGTSYYEYLAGLSDLVVILDEAHRYRADKASEALQGLRPLLGLELTATPQIEQGGKKEPERFANVLYSYDLAAAMTDGFVKQPAVATHAGLSDVAARAMDEGSLERLKLEDGVALHETTKSAIKEWATNHGKPVVKPFMLVVAKDIDHAGRLVTFLQSEAFFNGRYGPNEKGEPLVIQVHSKLKGVERDETVAELLAVEQPENPVEIVVHVNMLKEGWDVTNLYTIVPLNAASSVTLVEQSVGRGLRLPYGTRTGEAAVDRLTITAHDNYEAVVSAAKEKRFTFQHVVVRRTDPKSEAVVGRTQLQSTIASFASAAPDSGEPVSAAPAASARPRSQPVSSEMRRVLSTEAGRAAVTSVAAVIERRGSAICRKLGLPQEAASLQTPEAQALIAQEVQIAEAGGQISLGLLDEVELSRAGFIVQVSNLWVKHAVTIPLVTVQPEGTLFDGFEEFTVDTGAMNLPPLSDQVKVADLRHDATPFLLGSPLTNAEEEMLENYLIRRLIDRDDIDYGAHADVLYSLAGQVIDFLRKRWQHDDIVHRVLLAHDATIAKDLYSQMRGHRYTRATGYRATVTDGLHTVSAQAWSVLAGNLRPLRATLENKLSIRSLLFTDFKRGYFDHARFDSDAERQLALILDDDPAVRAWLKPAAKTFTIYYSAERRYEPDFIVETDTEKLLLEPKADNEVSTRGVQDKAAAAHAWVQAANAHEATLSQPKRWRYALIPHGQIHSAMTLSILVDTYEWRPPAAALDASGGASGRR